MSGGGGFIGDIIGGAADVVGGVLDTAGDVVSGAVDAVSSVAKNVDIKDAVLTYITTQNLPATFIAATNADEKLGFNPGAFYDPTSGGFGFQDVQMGGGQMPDVFNTNTFSNLANTAISKLADYAKSSPDQSAQYGQTGQKVLQSMSGILADVAAGKFSKSPASEYNTRSVLKSYYEGSDSNLSADLLNKYSEAKKKVATMIERPSSPFGAVALQDNPFYTFMQQRNIGQTQQAPTGLFDDFMKQQGII